jgi:hypothetical protein
MRFFIGIDWASQTHAICVIDQTGRVRWQGAVPHTAAGLTELVGRLRRFPGRLRVALERPSGLFLDTPVGGGIAGEESQRDRRVDVGENGRGAGPEALEEGAQLIGEGDALRDEGVAAAHERTQGARLVRGRAQRGEAMPIRAQQIREDEGVAGVTLAAGGGVAGPRGLEGVGVDGHHLEPGVDEPRNWARRFSPRRAARSVAELLARLRTAPASQVGEADAEASGDVVRALVAVLTPLVAQLQPPAAALAAALAQHPDGRLVQSLPRSGAVNAAQILAELGDDRARFPSDAQFAAESGLAPVTQASGQHKAVVFRWACNKRLRRALTTFADNSRHASRWAALVYQRARGCRHPHAIRILARAWARILWRCWQDRALYDVTRPRAVPRRAAA